MTGKLFFATAALGLSFATTATANPNVEYDGSLCITSITTGCQPMNWAVGECALIRFAPPNLGTNGAETRLSMFFHGSYAFNITANSGTLIGTAMKPVTAIRTGTVAASYAATARFSSQAPASPTSATKVISFNGNINNFDINGAGCNIGFQASTVRQP